VNVLIVEDDDSVARFLRQAISEAGYNPTVVGDGMDALDLAGSMKLELILLDLMIPHVNGFEVCRRLRESRITTPVLIITARDTVDDKVRGLDSGADDYIVKPFEIAELLARVRALLRRVSHSPAVLSISDLTLNAETRRACRAGKNIELSATEYSLLDYLMRNADRVVTRSMIMDHVWNYDFGGNDNILDVYISYLRSKIDKGNRRPLIHTIRGVGYRMSADET
jgi:DNA-binding response OmpR family regulator